MTGMTYFLRLESKSIATLAINMTNYNRLYGHQALDDQLPAEKPCT